MARVIFTRRVPRGTCGSPRSTQQQHEEDGEGEGGEEEEGKEEGGKTKEGEEEGRRKGGRG